MFDEHRTLLWKNTKQIKAADLVKPSPLLLLEVIFHTCIMASGVPLEGTIFVLNNPKEEGE